MLYCQAGRLEGAAGYLSFLGGPGVGSLSSDSMGGAGEEVGNPDEDG